MSPREHYFEAERLLDKMPEAIATAERMKMTQSQAEFNLNSIVAQAQVHAILATAVTP